MLCAVTSHRTRPRAALLAACAALGVVALAACSSTTSGSGQATNQPGSSAASTQDFPTGVAGSPSQSEAGSTAPVSTAAASGSAVHPAPAAPLRSATVHTSDGITYVIKIWADVSDKTCFDHAYGQPMITFLTQHPCRGLQRVLGTTTVKGQPVGFAESVTSFTGTPKDPYVDSGKFRQLEESDGTGSINDLLREGYRLPSGPTSVPSGEAFNVIGQDNGVSVWDVWYLDEPTPSNDKTLIKMTMDVFLQF
jgi:hypothetical protein